jgi:heat shock protein HtpX
MKMGIDKQIILVMVGLLIGFIGIVVRLYFKSFFAIMLEGILFIVSLTYIFTQMELSDVPFAISLIVYGWATFTSVFSANKNHAQYTKKIKRELPHCEVRIKKSLNRLLIDLFFTLLLFCLSMVYFIFNPNPVVSLVLLFGLFSLLMEMIKRIINFASLRVYYEEDSNILYVLTSFEGKRYPLEDAVDIELQSNVDILRLFPLFTMFNNNMDFTTKMGKTVKISFPGEKIYLTMPTDQLRRIEQIHINKNEQINKGSVLSEKEVLPFYHRKNLKRLLGKGYFAITVKGVGAYATLLVILTILKVPVWMMTVGIILFWIINLAISDRILKAALDVEEVTDEAVLKIARKVFQRANLPNITLYQMEATEYNGFAAGANIGRSIITLTTETLKLPLEAIEGILAHEAIHVKKRDILIGQFMRFVSMAIVIGIIFLVKFLFPNQTIFLFIIIWVLMVIFPVVYSLFTQWMEVRADHLGATLLDGGNEQMAKSLQQLAKKQDEAIEKSGQFNMMNTEDSSAKETVSSVERNKWYFRLLEFQFQSHPPMYWRIHSLRTTSCSWNVQKLKKWWRERMRESIPDKILK